MDILDNLLEWKLPLGNFQENSPLHVLTKAIKFWYVFVII